MEDEAFDGIVGRVLAGRYEVGNQLGSGGFGAVFYGRDLVLDRELAIKIRRPGQPIKQGGVRRFHREAKVLSQIQHPNVVQIMDFAEEGELLFIVMELVKGRPLSELIEESAPLSPDRIARLGIQVLDLLEEVHSNGIIHRDLKPENIMVECQRDGREFVKVLDFGIAFLDSRHDGSMTTDGLFTGTPNYSSPEQIRCEKVDERSDLYSMGCLLYDMLTGQPPFEAATPVLSLTAHLFRDPVSPAEKLGKEPDAPALEDAIMWCLKKLPDERPQSAHQLRQELKRALDEGFVTGRKLRAAVDRLSSNRSLGAVGTSNPLPPSVSGTAVLTLEHAADELATVIEAMRAQGNQVSMMRTLPDRDKLVKFAVAVLNSSDPRLETWCRSLSEARIPMLICGDEEDMDAMARALALGAHDFVPLPLNPVSLRRSLSRAARKRRRDARS